MIKEMEFAYTGEVQTQKLIPGIYKFEVWGAEGSVNGGKGGYSVGYYNVLNDTDVNIYVGGSGENGGFNGGGIAGAANIGSGGGASDIRINGNELTDRIIVAGGGGGGCSNGNFGGAGGGLNGEQGSNNGGAGGAQNKGNARGDGGGGTGSATNYDYDCTDATGSGYDILSYYYYYTGGGGGYYGGNRGLHHTTLARRHEHYPNGTNNSTSNSYQGAGGGSGYLHASLFTTMMETGVRSGDGFVKISSESYKFFNLDIRGKNFYLEPITDASVINSIKIFINNVEITELESSNETIIYNLPDDKTNMGMNYISITVNATVYGLTDNYTYGMDYIRYGEYIPENASLEVYRQYMDALSTQVNYLRNEFANILTENSITVNENDKISDMINIVKRVVEQINGKRILKGMKAGSAISINTGGSSSGGSGYSSWVLTSSPIQGLLPEGGEVRISWSVSYVNGGCVASIEVIRNEEVIAKIGTNDVFTGLQNGDVLRGSASATGSYGGIGGGGNIMVSYDYDFTELE